jgi:hypothetical protein
MIPSEQSRLLLRKAAPDQAVLEKLLKALLAHAGHDYPRSHNIGLLLDLLEEHGRPLPERLQAVEALTPFGTVFRYDDLPLEDNPDRHGWPPLIAALFLYVEAVINEVGDPSPEASA